MNPRNGNEKPAPRKKRETKGDRFPQDDRWAPTKGGGVLVAITGMSRVGTWGGFRGRGSEGLGRTGMETRRKGGFGGIPTDTARSAADPSHSGFLAVVRLPLRLREWDRVATGGRKGREEGVYSPMALASVDEKAMIQSTQSPVHHGRHSEPSSLRRKAPSAAK
jgi:hypothetical protein